MYACFIALFGFMFFVLFNPLREEVREVATITKLSKYEATFSNGYHIESLWGFSKDYHHIGDTVIFIYTKEYRYDDWELKDKEYPTADRRCRLQQENMNTRLNQLH